MKTIIIISLLLSTAAPVFAQDNFDIANIKKGHYFKNDSLRYLEGTWIGINDKNDTLKVILKFIEKREYGFFYFDWMKGWHEYTENGIVESSSMKDTFDLKKCTINIITSAVNDSVIFTLNDEGKLSGTASGTLIFKSLLKNELIWKVEGTSGPATIWLNGVPPPPMERSKLTVTREWKMIKIN